MKVVIRWVHQRENDHRVWFVAKKTLDLPFVPFIGLTIRICEAHYLDLDIEAVTWDHAESQLLCDVDSCVCVYPTIEGMEEDAEEMQQIGFGVRWSEDAQRLREEASKARVKESTNGK